VTLGERIKEARQQRGLTQEQLARRSGLTLNAYGDIERGRITDPHYSSLRGIARGLGITVAELVEESAPKAEAPSPSPEGTGAEVVPQIVALMRDVEEGEPGISREGLLEITAEWLRARYSEEELRDAERQLLATYRSFDRSFDSPMWNDAEQYEAWLELWDKIRAVQLALVAVGRALAAA
jgi:transcriptional regulator with XRE-family HTH domain